MSSSENQTRDDFQNWFTDEVSRSLTERSLQCLALLVVFIFASLGNGSVAFVLFKNFSIKNVPNMLLFCLTMVNFSIAMVNMPFAVISTAADEWLFGNVWCEISAFLNQYLTFTSNTMVTVIAVYRYQAIANTFSAQITFRGAKWITLFAWFYSLVFSIPPFFGWNTYRFSRKKGFCTLGWEDGGADMVYSLLVVLACFLIPFTVIVYVYVRIGVITRYNPRRPGTESTSSRTPSSPVTARARDKRDVTSHVTTRDHGSRMQNQKLSKKNHSNSKDSIQESKTITSVSYVTMTFVLLLAPYYVMNIASALSQDSLSSALDFAVAWLHYCHAGAVAIVYGYFNQKVRIFLKQLPWWPKCPGCGEEQEERFDRSPYIVNRS